MAGSNPRNTISDKVALVTGATGSIGRAIVRQLASDRRFEIVLICRDKHKARASVEEIRTQTGNRNVRYVLADLSVQNDIEKLAGEWFGSLHLLINNAAITPTFRQESYEGIEMQLATNVLGYFRLIRFFKEKLIASAPARIVNVASYWAGGLDIQDLEFKIRRYHNDAAYRQSKQADRMLSAAFAEQLEPFRVTVNSCHPGDVSSNLSRQLGFGGHETPEQAAQTPVWLATNPIGEERTGKYFEYLKESPCHFSADRQAVHRLYQACLSYDR